MAKKQKQSKFSDQIRDAVDACGTSHYRICKETGIDQSTLSRFMSGTRGMTIDALDILAAYLDLRVVAGKTRKFTKPKGK